VTTLSIDALDLATVADQASNVYGAFTGLLAVIAGVGVGAYVWQRLRGAAQSV
jgi:flagellar biogenesis protein FliO